MTPILRNVLAVVLGWFVGSALNMGIITLYPSIFPLPEKIIDGDFQSFIDNVHLLDISHLVSVFLAHSLGTLIGAFLAAKIGAYKHLTLSMIVGALFLLGGITINSMLGFQPLSFSIVDILLAYIPMAWIGWKLAHPLNHITKNQRDSRIIDGSLS